MEVPTANFITALHDAFKILIAVLFTGFIYYLNYRVTIEIQKYDERNRNRH